MQYQIHSESKKQAYEKGLASYLSEGWEVVSTIPTGWYEPSEHQTHVAEVMVTFKRAIG